MVAVIESGVLEILNIVDMQWTSSIWSSISDVIGEVAICWWSVMDLECDVRDPKKFWVALKASAVSS